MTVTVTVTVTFRTVRTGSDRLYDIIMPYMLYLTVVTSRDPLHCTLFIWYDINNIQKFNISSAPPAPPARSFLPPCPLLP